MYMKKCMSSVVAFAMRYLVMNRKWSKQNNSLFIITFSKSDKLIKTNYILKTQ